MRTTPFPWPLRLIYIALFALGATLSLAKAQASERIDAIESPRLKFGETTVGLQAYGYSNTRNVCRSLGYAEDVDARMWSHETTPSDVDFVIYPYVDEYTLFEHVPKTGTSIWQRILCKGPGTFPRLDQVIPVTTVNAPGTQVGPLFVRFDAFGHSNADAICKKIGFEKSFSAETAWKYIWIGKLPEYIQKVKYVHRVNLDLSLTGVTPLLYRAGEGNLVWDKIHCVGRATPTFAGSIDLANLGATLSTVAEQMYTERKVFLEGARKAVESAQARGGYDRVQAQVFAALALDPFMTHLDSKWYQTKVAPAWNRDIPDLAHKADVRSLRDIFPTPNVARTALGLLHEGFAAMQNSVNTPSEQAAVVEIQKNIGYAAASTFKATDSSMQKLISTLDNHSAVLTNLKINTRTAAIAHSMSAIVEYLRVYYVN